MWTIYCHTHVETGRRYIGMTRLSMLKRWNRHVYNALHPLKSKHNGQSHFANAIRKYGKERFSHEVLEACEFLEVAQLAEESWIEFYETRNPFAGFNLMRGGLHIPHPISNPWERPGFREKISAAMMGKRLSSDTIAKIAAVNRGKKHSPEHIEKVAAAHRGKSLSLELRAKLSQIMTGKTHTLEARARMSVANSGRIVSNETKAKLSAKSKGRLHTLEARVRMSEIKKIFYTHHPAQGKRHTPKSNAKNAAAHLGKSPSTETRIKLSEIHRGRKQNPDAIAKRTATRAMKKFILKVMEA